MCMCLLYHLSQSCILCSHFHELRISKLLQKAIFQIKCYWGLIYKTSYDSCKIVIKSSQLCHIFVVNQQVTMS